MSCSPLRRGPVLGALLIAALAVRPLAAQMSDQSFEITATPDSATVGDTVTLHLRLRLSERDMLFDTIPVPLGPRLPGEQILSIGRLARGPDRVFVGEAKVAFFRPGRQEVPSFGIAFARVIAAVERAVLSSQPTWIEITPTLPPGDQPLKDIKPIEPTPAPRWPWALIPVLALVGLWFRRRLQRRRPASTLPASAPGPMARDSLHEALDRLRTIEQELAPSDEALALRYEAVANVVRDYLAEAERTPARELTTTELLRALGGRNQKQPALDRCRRVLAEADQVKFAAARPDAGAAGEHLAAARELITQWPSHQNGARHAAG